MSDSTDEREPFAKAILEEVDSQTTNVEAAPGDQIFKVYLAPVVFEDLPKETILGAASNLSAGIVAA